MVECAVNTMFIEVAKNHEAFCKSMNKLPQLPFTTEYAVTLLE